MERARADVALHAPENEDGFRGVSEAHAWQERGTRILDEVRSSGPFEAIDVEDPWSAASLDSTERRMLENWSTAEDIPAEVRSQYELFLGEGLRRRFGGEWESLTPGLLGAASEDQPAGRGVRYRTTGTIDVVSSLVAQAYRAGTGTWWSSSFETTGQLSSGDGRSRDRSES